MSQQLCTIQRDVTRVKEVSDNFVRLANEKLELRWPGDDISTVQNDFPQVRSRNRKLMPSEKCKDQPITNGFDKFTIETHNIILDTVVSEKL